MDGPDIFRHKTGFPSLSLCAPCFNEAHGIESVVKGWLAALYYLCESFEIIVVDDGSSDGTYDILNELAADEARMLVLRFDENQGYGEAIKTAVMASRGSYVATIDSDGQFIADDLEPMLDFMKENNLDLLNGIRRKADDRRSARGGDKLLRAIAKTLYGCKTTDPQCALKLWKGSFVRNIANSVGHADYLTPTLWALAAQTMMGKMGEMSVRHLRRETDESKLRPFRDGFKMIKDMFGLKRKLKPVKMI